MKADTHAERIREIASEMHIEAGWITVNTEYFSKTCGGTRNLHGQAVAFHGHRIDSLYAEACEEMRAYRHELPVLLETVLPEAVLRGAAANGATDTRYLCGALMHMLYDPVPQVPLGLSSTHAQQIAMMLRAVSEVHEESRPLFLLTREE